MTYILLAFIRFNKQIKKILLKHMDCPSNLHKETNSHSIVDL